MISDLVSTHKGNDNHINPIYILMFRTIFYLVIEFYVLRQQLSIMKKSIKRPKIRTRDRIF